MSTDVEAPPAQTSSRRGRPHHKPIPGWPSRRPTSRCTRSGTQPADLAVRFQAGAYGVVLPQTSPMPPYEGRSADTLVAISQDGAAAPEADLSLRRWLEQQLTAPPAAADGAGFEHSGGTDSP